MRTHAQKYFARLEKLSHGDTSLRRSINDFNGASVDGVFTIVTNANQPVKSRSDSVDGGDSLKILLADNIMDYHHRNYDHHCHHGHLDEEASRFSGQEHVIVKKEQVQSGSDTALSKLISQSSSYDAAAPLNENSPPLKKLKSVTDLYIQRSESVRVFERILNFSSGSLILDDEFWMSDDNDE